jgi:AP-3 complex subunit mu
MHSIALQLLDEMMDNGFPLTTEPNLLKDIVAPPNLVAKVLTAVTGKASPAVGPTLPEAAASCVPWRTAHPKNTTNELYVNLVEQLDACVTRSIFFSPQLPPLFQLIHSDDPNIRLQLIRLLLLL